MTREILLRRLAWLLLAALVGLLYAGSLDAPFVYDDKIEVIGNRTIRALTEWRAVLAYNVSRPLVILSYAWDFSRFGLEPRGYHIENVVLHLLSVGAALELAAAVGRLFQVARPLRVGGLAVALWAVHPMLTEAVAYTTGRSETLCGLFAFLCLAAWATALSAEGEGKAGWPWRLAAGLAFLGAAGSKEVGWVLPPMLATLELLAPRSGPLDRRKASWYLPFVLLLGAGIALRVQAVGHLLPREADRSLGVQLTTSAEVWIHYLRLWLLPLGQTLFHDQPDVSPLSLRGLAAWLGWLLLVGGGIAWGRRRPVVGLALACAAWTLLPSTSFLSLKEHLSEHRSYQAGLFLVLGLAWSVPTSWHRRAAPVAALLVLAAAGATLLRVQVWGSEVRLWEEAAQRRPESAEAWYGLGDARRFAKDFKGARQAYQRSSELDPERLDTWNNLGIAAAEVGDADEARRAWRQALRIKPSYCRGHNNLGSLAYREQRWDEAVGELRSTLAYCPTDPIAHYLLGNIYYGPRRDKERAIFHYEEVIRSAPDFDHADLVKQRLLELTW